MGCCTSRSAQDQKLKDEKLKEHIFEFYGVSVDTIDEWMRDPHLLAKQMERQY